MRLLESHAISNMTKLPKEHSTWMEYAEHYTRNHKVNSELMELDWSCFVKVKCKTMPMFTHGKVVDNDRNKYISIMFGCPSVEHYVEDHMRWDIEEILGKQAQLQHFLKVLGTFGKAGLFFDGKVGEVWLYRNEKEEFVCIFNLSTGRPASEEDAKEYVKLVT